MSLSQQQIEQPEGGLPVLGLGIFEMRIDDFEVLNRVSPCDTMFVSVSLYGLCSLPLGMRLTRSIGELLASPCAGGTSPQASPKLRTAVRSANAAMTFMNYPLLITAHEAAERHRPIVNGHADINRVEVRVPAQLVLDITLDV
jgi:hypothetical protein